MWQYERDRENEIRTVQQDGEPWFVLKDVRGLLGLTDIGRTAKRLDSDELTRTTLVSGGQNREILIVNESGTQTLITPKGRETFRLLMIG